jgi:hypothetical protein
VGVGQAPLLVLDGVAEPGDGAEDFVHLDLLEHLVELHLEDARDDLRVHQRLVWDSENLTSKSFWLIFGRIDCSRRVLGARPNACEPFTYAHVEVTLKI